MPHVETAHGSSARSTAKKLVQAAALAAALVPLGSIQSEAATITCGFNGATDGTSGCGSLDSGLTTTFNFDGFKVGLQFFFDEENPNADTPFTISITNTPLGQGAFSERLGPGLEDYQCVTLTNPDEGPGCQSLTFESSTEEFWDRYNTLFAWDFPTDGTFPNGDDPEGAQPGQVRVLRAPGAPGSTFTIDMCLAAVSDSDYVPCAYFSGEFDPAVKSGDTRFSDQIVAWTPTAVPEPASLALLGTGLAGLLYRKRRNLKG